MLLTAITEVYQRLPPHFFTDLPPTSTAVHKYLVDRSPHHRRLLRGQLKASTAIGWSDHILDTLAEGDETESVAARELFWSIVVHRIRPVNYAGLK